MVQHKAYIYGQKLENNFTNNGTLQKLKNSKKFNNQYAQIPLAPKEILYQNSLGMSLDLKNLDAQTNEELPAIYKKNGMHYCTNPNNFVNKN